MTRFAHKEDKDYVLTEGPWLIGGHYLAIQPWKPQFNPKTESINKLAVWIRVTNLSTEYMRASLLRKIDNLIGTTFKVDINTTNQSRGRFARVCVQLDLDQPFKTSVCIDGIWFNLEYQGLNMICFECGKFGLLKEECLKRKEVRADTNLVTDSRQPPPITDEPIPYEPWMQVPSSTRGRKPNAKRA